jgi:DeoR family glycerol-3-phosphate regulon repressor
MVVTDHTKFGRRGLIHVCGFADLDMLVTDRAPPAAIVAALGAADTALTVAAT